MDEIGVVRSVQGSTALVLVEKKSACDQCSAGCKLGDAGAEIEALNEAHAEVGQIVRVLLAPSSYLRGSLIVYGIPSAALIAGAIVGKELLARLFPGRDPDALSAAAGFGAFLLSLVFVKILSLRSAKKVEGRPIITEIIGDHQSR